MKTFVVALLVVAAVFAAPVPQLTLKDGRTLQNVEFLSYNPTVIVAKWEGGRGFLKYEDLPDDVLAKVTPMRPKSVGAAPAAPVSSKPASSATPAAKRTVVGQVFITTKGAGAYKFAGATVTAYSLGYLDNLQTNARAMIGKHEYLQDGWRKVLKGVEVLGQATTDAEGRFEISYPASQQVFLFCCASRLLSKEVECNLWTVPVSPGSNICDLNGDLCQTWKL